MLGKFRRRAPNAVDSGAAIHFAGIDSDFQTKMRETVRHDTRQRTPVRFCRRLATRRTRLPRRLAPTARRHFHQAAEEAFFRPPAQ